MIPVYSAWLAAHGKLWYDDKWYRFAWIAWPQALAVVVLLWFWATPSTSITAQWARPLDISARAGQLQALRDSARKTRVGGLGTSVHHRDQRAGAEAKRVYLHAGLPAE